MYITAAVPKHFFVAVPIFGQNSVTVPPDVNTIRYIHKKSIIIHIDNQFVL